jgi:hypothetical protein
MESEARAAPIRHVVCAELGEPGGSEKHRHIVTVGVEDDDGSVTRWDALDDVDAIHHGERFVVRGEGDVEVDVEAFVCPDCRRGTVQAVPRAGEQDDLLLSLGSCN